MAIACPDCGTIQALPPLPKRGIARCPRCRHVLERRAGRSIEAALACAVATTVLLVAGSFLPFLRVGMLGATRQSLLGSGVVVLWDEEWVVLATLVLLFGIALPLVRFSLLSLTLATVLFERRPAWLGPAFRWATRLDLWAMPDVLLIAALIGYSRVAAKLPVAIGAGGWCFAAAALLSMVTQAALDRRTVWRAIGSDGGPPPSGPALSCLACDLALPLSAEGGRCPRCGAPLHARKPDALIGTTALLVAGFVLYLPANIYPMSVLRQPGGMEGHTIFNGIERLVGAHLWPLAAVIFCTSIGIPLLKLLGLGWLLLSVRRGSHAALVGKTKLHRLINDIGRWSNVDPFTIAIFAPLMHFDGIVKVEAGAGALAFILVVVVTMFASALFDPRQLWDRTR